MTTSARSDDPTITLPSALVSDVLEELYELRGARDWWRDETRSNYQRDYQRLCDTIATIEAALGRAPMKGSRV
jgi:hypothetical protein